MKKTILKIIAIATFAVLMGFNVTTSMNNTNFSLSGLSALAFGTGGSGGGGSSGPCLGDWECDVGEVCINNVCTSGVNRCAYSGTWAPDEKYRDCDSCDIISGWDAAEISTCQ